MKNLSALYGRLLSALALAGCAVLFAMMLVICLDVLLRNVRIVPGWLGIAWANEATEYALYLITLLTAPWLLRRPPYLLETSLPGVFAVGDVRGGNVKRVASAVGEGSIAVSFVQRVLAE